MSSQVLDSSVRHTSGSRDVTVSFPLHGHQKSIDCVQICAHHNNFLKTQNVTCGQNWNGLSYTNDFEVLI